MLHGRGVLRVTHGRGPLVQALARLLRLPRSGDAVDTQLTVTPWGGGERWERMFDDRRLDSYQHRSSNGDLVERFRHLELTFHRDASDEGAAFDLRGARLVLGRVRVPLPRAFAPRVMARERPAGPHRIHVDVRVELPALGPLLTYEGVIDVEEIPS